MFDDLVAYLKKEKLFVTAVKKLIKYKMVGSMKDMVPSTFYVHNEDEKRVVVTNIAGAKETQNTASRGDVVMMGKQGEMYVVPCGKFLKLYNVTDGVAQPRQEKRIVAMITKKVWRAVGVQGDSVVFKAPWGEDMMLKAGDVLVKDPSGDGFYRVEKEAFKMTYKQFNPL